MIWDLRILNLRILCFGILRSWNRFADLGSRDLGFTDLVICGSWICFHLVISEDGDVRFADLGIFRPWFYGSCNLGSLWQPYQLWQPRGVGPVASLMVSMGWKGEIQWVYNSSGHTSGRFSGT